MSSFLGSLGGLTGGAGAIGVAKVELLLDAGKYQAQLAAAEGETTASTAQMEAATAKSSAAMSAAWLGAAGGAALFAKASVEAAIEQQQASDKLTNAILNSSKVSIASKQAFDTQANALRALTGVSDEAVTSGQSLLVQMGLTADQITQLTPLVVDLSAKNGVDLSAAFKAVGKAAEGSTGALARYVGPVQKGTTASETFQNVLTKLGAVEGYAAQKADAEPWVKLQAQFHELQETVGKGLLPTLVDVSGVLADISAHRLPDASQALGVFQASLAATNPLAASWVSHLHEAQVTAETLQAPLANLDQQVRNGTVTQADAISQLEALQGQANLTSDAQSLLAETIAHYSGEAAGATSSTEKLAAAHKKAAQAARDQKTAENELAGGFVGLLSSLEQLRTDQEAVNKLKQHGKTDTDAYAQAIQTELQDQLSYSSAIKDLTTNMKDAGASTADVRDKVIQLGHEAGLSKSDIQALLDSVSSGAKSAKDNITGLGDAMDGLRQKFKAPLTIQVQVQAATSGLTPGSSEFADAVRAAILRSQSIRGG